MLIKLVYDGLGHKACEHCHCTFSRMDNLTDADSTALGLQVAIAIVLVLLTTCVWLVWKLQATQGQLQTTEGQLQATQGQLQTTEGQLQATQGQLQATEGQLQATQGQLQATQEVRDKVAGTWWRTNDGHFYSRCCRCRH